MNTSNRGKSSLRLNRRNIPHSILLGIYDVLLPLGKWLISLLSPFNPKLKKSIEGRRGGVKSWHINSSNKRSCILIHASSYGEYEGIRPLIDRLIEDGKTRIAVSYSSPSARKVVESTDGLWAYGFLPFDFLSDQLKLLARLEPDVIIVTKHDLWPNMVRAAKALRIPVILVNANFPAGSSRLAPISRNFHRSFMRYLEAVWAVSEMDAKRADQLLNGEVKIEALGDSRYDRVRQRAIQGQDRFKNLKSSLSSERVFIIGSSWQKDERICWDAFARLKPEFPEIKMIVVPHEPTPEALDRNRRLCSDRRLDYKLFSEWKDEKIPEAVLLVDKMGVLADIYTVGWAAHVGGGFGKGVHSVIEPAAHGLPVSFGPNHGVSHEASLLLQENGGFAVKTSDDIYNIWIRWLSDENVYRKTATAAEDVVKKREGITEMLVTKLKPYLD